MNKSLLPLILCGQIVAACLVGPMVWFIGQHSVDAGIVGGSWAALLLLAWSAYSWWAIRRTLFEPYPAFLLAAFLFNAGHALLEVFGANAKGFLFNRVEPEQIFSALLLVLVALAWLHTGALISVCRRPVARTAPLPRVAPWSPRIVGIVLVGISIWPAYTTLKQTLTRSLETGYLSTYQQDFATGAGAASDVLAALLVPAALFLLAGTCRSRGRFVALAIVTAVVGVNLMIGARITAVMAVFGLGWQWHVTVRRIRLQWLVAAALTMMLVVFPVVRTVRDGSGSERYSLAALTASFKEIENPAVDILSELGSSMSSVAYTMSLVPERRPFDYGVGYAYAALAVIPNVFWSLHPTVARGLAADWLIWEVDPFTAARQGGLGYSFIAEAYLNVGWLGTPIIMVVLGYFVVALTRWATDAMDPARFAAVSAFMTFFLRFPRGESAGVIRPLIWYAVAPYLAVRVLDWTRRRRLAGSVSRPIPSVAHSCPIQVVT